MTITELGLRSLGMTPDGRKNTKKVIEHKADKKAGRAKHCQAAECKNKEIPLSAYATNDYCEACMTHERHLGNQEVKAKRADRGAPELSGEEKSCNQCGEVKDLVHFYRDSRGYLGRKRFCKACCAKYQKEHKKKKREGAS